MHGEVGVAVGSSFNLCSHPEQFHSVPNLHPMAQEDTAPAITEPPFLEGTSTTLLGASPLEQPLKNLTSTSEVWQTHTVFPVTLSSFTCWYLWRLLLSGSLI